MKSPIPIFFTCTHCGHVHAETLQNAISGRMPAPLPCPQCQRALAIDWDALTRLAQASGLPVAPE
ncbi:hypothetical protein BKK79_32160 [Cupriavidus sp. USMAA2-4]|uniref:hypothetical protein n=1 Tax=Cupriavidus sp. USMAA2-4 TaxID=876364 RepID=UPI0008A6A884|nr:hypothetical protein [Cupriavidus sp. USMAA2-4]AOY96264.1 hypothetical protein BKK79_32160 [Cupriavidus sp. USMAA2-4]